jgi:plasmid stabilization system protein ParE
MNKPRRLIWAITAIHDVHDIVKRMARDNGNAALGFAGHVIKTADNIALTPHGLPGELAGTLEQVLSRYPHYIIIYTVNHSTVTIVRIFRYLAKSKFNAV